MGTVTEILAAAHTESIRLRALDGYDIRTHNLIPIGTPVIWHAERWITAHSLDAIALEHSNVYTRLDAATGWCLSEAHRKLDALAAVLARPEERTYTLPTILEHNESVKHVKHFEEYDVDFLHEAFATEVPC